MNDGHTDARRLAMGDAVRVRKGASVFNGRIGIVANRVRSNTLVSQSLTRFLNSLDIPLVATLRDAQNYVRAAEMGLGIHEMPQWQVRQDLASWEPITRWLQDRQVRPVGTAERELVSIVSEVPAEA